MNSRRHSSIDKSETQELTGMPPDPNHLEPTALTKWTMGALGLGVLLPFNCVLSTMSFFLTKFGPGFAATGTAAYSTLLFFGLLGMSVAGQFISCWTRNCVGFIGMAASLVGLVVSAMIFPGQSGTAAGILMFGAVGFFGAISQSTSAEICSISKSADLFVNFLFGQGLAGILSLVVVVAAMLLASSAQEGDAAKEPMTEAVVLTFFVSSAIFLCICGLSHLWLKRDPLIQRALNELRSRDVLVTPTGLERSNRNPKLEEMKKTIKEVIITTRDVALPAISLILVFVITFTVFPAQSSQWKSAIEGFGTQWLQITLVGTFQLGDALGRYMPKFKWAAIPGAVLILPVVLRAVLVPLFCGRTVEGAGLLSGVILVMALFSITNGWFATSACIFVTVKAKDEHKAAAGRLISLYACSGIMFGSWLAGTIGAWFC
eukprot:Selendium_serpulae@DN5971_c0_g1_i1.p1